MDRPVRDTADRAGWEFDARGFATALVVGRQERGWSSRDLASRADISQAYVVALERAANPRRGEPGREPPIPTIDVLARLARAFGQKPHELLGAGIRRAGRHVLLVVDEPDRSAFEVARRAAGRRSADAWVWAGSDGLREPVRDADQRRIDLRRDASQAYDPAAISGALERELVTLVVDDRLDGADLGVVFGETSAVMSTLDDPRTILDFEHRWAGVVARAARAAGARAAWNVCVYEQAAVRALPDRVEATLDLVRSHDTLWHVRGARVLRGADGARQLLGGLRPDHIGATAWRREVDRLVDELGHAA